MTEPTLRRILTIDGGGIKGVFPASFLATIEDTIQNGVTDYFDLIVGTSTGGIIALGLGLGLSPGDILRFYGSSDPEIFGGHRLVRSIRNIRVSKYSNRPLRSALESVFGKRRLGESSKRLVIPSLNLENGEVYIYKTAHHPRFERDYQETVVDVALATAAAPTFFPAHRSAAGTPLIDGGVWANNPTGLAAVEAIGVLGWPKDSLRVLSLGCTSEPFGSGGGGTMPRGLAYWAPRIVGLFMTAQGRRGLGTAYTLLGHDRVLRIDPQVSRGQLGLYAYKLTEPLKGLGDSEARKALPKIRHMFIDEGPAGHFDPYQKLNGQIDSLSG